MFVCRWRRLCLLVRYLYLVLSLLWRELIFFVCRVRFVIQVHVNDCPFILKSQRISSKRTKKHQFELVIAMIRISCCSHFKKQCRSFENKYPSIRILCHHLPLTHVTVVFTRAHANIFCPPKM